MKRLVRLMVTIATIWTTLPPACQAQAPMDPGQRGPHETASVTVSVRNPETGSVLVVDLHYPGNTAGVDATAAPYAALVFIPGFLASSSTYPGNGAHLASWGYIVAIPDISNEDVEVRASDVRFILSYLVGENVRSGSAFYGQIDTERLGLVGHSLDQLANRAVVQYLGPPPTQTGQLHLDRRVAPAHSGLHRVLSTRRWPNRSSGTYTGKPLTI